jgi:hypothetical protein
MCIKCANFRNKNKGQFGGLLFVRYEVKTNYNSTNIDTKVRDLNSESGIDEDSSPLNYSAVSIGKQFLRLG